MSSSSAESFAHDNSVYSDAKCDQEPSNYDITKSAEMTKSNKLSQLATARQILVSHGGCDDVVKILDVAMREELKQSSSGKCDNNRPVLRKEDKGGGKSKYASIRSSLKMTLPEVGAVVRRMTGTNEDDVNTVGCNHLYTIAKLLNKGSGVIVSKAMKENLVFRQKVFDQACKEGGGEGYSFNRVTVSGIILNDERPHTVVKYVESE